MKNSHKSLDDKKNVAEDSSLQLAELLGIMLGDGCLSLSGKQNFVYISGHKFDDIDYHSATTKSLFKNIFNKEVYIKLRNDENTMYIKFSDRSIFNALKMKGVPVGVKYDFLTIPDFINSDNRFKAFMRGLFDTDGCVVLSKQHRNYHYYPRLEIASKSRSFLFEILVKLRTIGFYGSLSKKSVHFRLEIPGFKNLDLWSQMIGFNNPKHSDKVRKINSKRL